MNKLTKGCRNRIAHREGTNRKVNPSLTYIYARMSAVPNYEKGSFTGATSCNQGHFEVADSGTLFLDEIRELPLTMQVKLLRVLQEGEVKRIGATKAKKVDVRIVAATNKNLLKETAAGNFREDLFYRLAVAVIQLPPLRLLIACLAHVPVKIAEFH